MIRAQPFCRPASPGFLGRSCAGTVSTMRRSPAVVVLLLLGLGLLAPACGGGDRSPFEVVSAASATTAEAKTSKLAMTMTLKGQDVTVDGAFDYTNQRGRLELDAGSMGIPGVSGTIDAISDGLVVYMRFPKQLADQLPGAKPWLKLDVAKLGEVSGVDFSALTQQQSQDPTATLDFLRGASKDGVTKVGEEDVRGTNTTHYRGTADLSLAASKAPAAKRKAIEQVADLTGIDEIPFDVWVDGDDRVRKMELTEDLSNADPAKTGGQSLGEMKISMELFEFGTAVDATPPPADQTTDLLDLIGK